jgi:hypothetical protein
LPEPPMIWFFCFVLHTVKENARVKVRKSRTLTRAISGRGST